MLESALTKEVENFWPPPRPDDFEIHASELSNPRTEVFRKKLTAFSDRHFSETTKQNSLADILRYNFSNGIQLSSQNILRHPLHKNVSLELLPRPVSGAPLFSKWPLLADSETGFVSKLLAAPAANAPAGLDLDGSRSNMAGADASVPDRPHPDQGTLAVTRRFRQ